MNHYGYCWGNPINLFDGNGNWPEWVETTVKVVTVTTAVVAVGAVIVGTGGLGAAVLAGAAAGGAISGFANEAAGGSYTNGFIGGAVTGTIQTLASTFGGPAGMVVGGAANGLGSLITDNLDNLDKSVVKKRHRKK